MLILAWFCLGFSLVFLVVAIRLHSAIDQTRMTDSILRWRRRRADEQTRLARENCRRALALHFGARSSIHHPSSTIHHPRL